MFSNITNMFSNITNVFGNLTNKFGNLTNSYPSCMPIDDCMSIYFSNVLYYPPPYSFQLTYGSSMNVCKIASQSLLEASGCVYIYDEKTWSSLIKANDLTRALGSLQDAWEETYCYGNGCLTYFSGKVSLSEQVGILNRFQQIFVDALPYTYFINYFEERAVAITAGTLGCVLLTAYLICCCPKVRKCFYGEQTDRMNRVRGNEEDPLLLN